MKWLGSLLKRMLRIRIHILSDAEAAEADALEFDRTYRAVSERLDRMVLRREDSKADGGAA